MVRLVAFDMDGTLLDEAGRPDPAALQTLGRAVERGVCIASVSGRSIRRSLEPLAPHPDLALHLHVSAYNGAAAVTPVRDGRRALLYAHRLPADVLRALLEYAGERGLNVIYCRCDVLTDRISEEYRYLQRPQDEMSRGWGGPGWVHDPGLLEQGLRGELPPPPKIMLTTNAHDPARIVEELTERLAGRIYVAWAVSQTLEIMHPDVNKGTALQWLAQTLQIPASEVLAVGDGNNDLPMLRAAGLGVLMGNAAPQVRRAAAAEGIRLGPSFAEGGLARTLHEHVLT